jgi:hypothetical protein
MDPWTIGIVAVALASAVVRCYLIAVTRHEAGEGPPDRGTFTPVGPLGDLVASCLRTLKRP